MFADGGLEVNGVKIQIAAVTDDTLDEATKWVVKRAKIEAVGKRFLERAKYTQGGMKKETSTTDNADADMTVSSKTRKAEEVEVEVQNEKEKM
ncbi:hypothetical protein PsorP6_012699 [Peronosclerospora sorghi]|uniref:Uncharacterized protein n=1 Tax=Peronosclerospora sorghi TaxID=230839 RepID=A0ACC0WGN2_9STRA|nr:hypothetical protein PsorP6_012699 [Peronosclerospora sorghi]